MRHTHATSSRNLNSTLTLHDDDVWASMRAKAVDEVNNTKHEELAMVFYANTRIALPDGRHSRQVSKRQSQQNDRVGTL